MIYAASDLHGRWEKYRALLERLSHEDPDYTLYLLGDSIDRNKGGCRILLDAMKRPNVISLLGNHEFSAAVCLPWLLQEVTEENLSAVDQERITSGQEWIFNGGAPTLEELRERIGMVLQTNVLFTGTIRENLLWGDPNATEEDMIQAAKDAQAYDFIMSFPDGFDTVLDQGGVNVSGGQKQRLCIARAMLRKPAILILDDSTSAVDSATDAAIRESFAKNLKGTTVIMIAQRISSVQYADEIIILDDDHIAGQGTHEELLASNSIYQEIYRSQQEGVGE